MQDIKETSKAKLDTKGPTRPHDKVTYARADKPPNIGKCAFLRNSASERGNYCELKQGKSGMFVVESHTPMWDHLPTELTLGTNKNLSLNYSEHRCIQDDEQ